MGRPRKEEGTVSARERIITAFWNLYTTTAFEEISVKEVCAGAQCNKTTFYYYFEDLREVLDVIEERCLPVKAPLMVPALLQTDNQTQLVTGLIASMGEEFDRYCILLSSNGDPGFAARARATMTKRWSEALGVNYDQLDAEDQLAMRLAMGGSMSILADRGDGQPFNPEVFARTIIKVVEPLVTRILAKYPHNASLTAPATAQQ